MGNRENMELFLPNDVIESILERIDVKTLLKFQSISKQWRSTIQSSYFQQRQFMRRQSKRDPEVLLVSVKDPSKRDDPGFEALRTLSLGLSPVSLRIPTPWEGEFYQVCKTSCDGLVYLYDLYEIPSIVVNPTTRWHRTVPLCNYQLFAHEKAKKEEFFDVNYPSPGFGKDIINGTYKPVWLYNSAELGLNDNPTTCEVFDFATNSWRCVVPDSPYLILQFPELVYFNGSLYCFTAFSPQGETMVLSFDLHTETFEIICKAPFLYAVEEKINICNLDGRLCVCEEKGVNQIIWSFDSVYKTWNQIYSIDLNLTYPFLLERNILTLQPLGVLGKDNVLLFYDREHGKSLVTLDPKTQSYHLAHASKSSAAYYVCYFPSLVSIL